MRYGRTSMVNFLSKLGMSLAGFVATIVLTRTLGRDAYGTYVVVLSVLAWVALAGDFGLHAAIKKRISEHDGGNHLSAGIFAQIVLYLIVATTVWALRPYLNNYMEIDATGILIGLLAVHLASNFVQVVLDGEQLVHVSSVLSPVEWTGRSGIQIVLVLSGFGLAGAFAGYLIGGIIATITGAYFVSGALSWPSRQDFRDLKSYAQFSWLGSIKGRTFLSMDTLVLAVFVSNSLIAVYEIAWNLASLYAIFGSSIRRTLFPEISKLSSESNLSDNVTDLLRVSLMYSGLFIIPGLVGAVVVGDIVLKVYGSGFETGYYILILLSFARLLYSYAGQFLTTLSGIDRPDLTFRINAVFVATNLVLNIFLTWLYGWFGAAVATTISAALMLLLGYYYTNRVLKVEVATIEIGKQWLAAAAMAGVVFVLRVVLGDTIPVVVVLVAVGAAVYFVVLLVLSAEFRVTVDENLPFVIPLLGSE